MKVRRVMAHVAERTGAQNGAVGSNLDPKGVAKSLSSRLTLIFGIHTCGSKITNRQPGTCTGDSSLLLCTVGKSTSSAKTASGSMIYMNFYSMTTECLCVAENRGYIEIKHR